MEDIGKFYCGDCYIVLYTYHSGDKKEDYYLCCWIGKDSIEDPHQHLQLKSYEDSLDGSPGQGDSVSSPAVGPESWPLQVVNQQPRHVSSLLQKLHSSDSVDEAVTRECNEQQRKIEMEGKMKGATWPQDESKAKNNSL